MCTGLIQLWFFRPIQVWQLATTRLVQSLLPARQTDRPNDITSAVAISYVLAKATMQPSNKLQQQW